MRTPKELAYAAGLFEGEGNLSIGYRQGTRIPRTCVVRISMTDREPLEKFQAAVGLGVIRGPYGRGITPLGTEKKPFWVWYVNRFEYAQAVVAMLWPDLGPRRRIAAEKMLREVGRR